MSVKIKGLVVLTVLYLFSLPLQSNSAQSRISGANSAGVSNRLTLLGTYSDMRFTQEHAYGSQVDLWRQGKELVGHFLHSEGLSGDTPTGLMEKVSYDPNSRRLSFEARLTLGKHYCRTHHGLPSRDKFIFDGTLNKGSITGSLEREDGFHPESPGMRKEVRLRKRVSPGLNDFESRQQWEQYSKDILRYRGPRW